MTEIPLYFDFISPYAYFAHLQVARIEERHQVNVQYRPVLFAAILNHHGQLGPAEIESKREFTFRDIARYAAQHAIPLRGPATHPFVPTTALRVALPEVAGEHQVQVIDVLFRQGWGNGLDLADPRALAAALEDAGLPGSAMVERTQEPAVKEALKQSTAHALELGVFGVPTFEIAGELVWGNDRISTVEAILAGVDPLPEDAIQRLLDIPRGATRPGSHRTR
ncbi:MAG: 2-hydroxychromene-2-carboxylate isomerase [Myxococcota bacterium]